MIKEIYTAKTRRDFGIGDKIICIDDSPYSFSNGIDFIYNGQPVFTEMVKKGSIYCVRGISDRNGLYLVGIIGILTKRQTELSWSKDRFKIVNNK